MVSFIILANSKSAALKQMTADLIASLEAADIPASHSLNAHRILVIETQPNVQHSVETITYKPKVLGQFNYNEALNQAICYLLRAYNEDTDWFCILNNDVIVSKHWLTAIASALDIDPQMQSICPNIRELEPCIKYGYTLWKHLDGCCILFRKEVLYKIGGLFDERFLFYFQDDDYLEQLRLHHVKHAKVMTSLVKHLGSQTQLEDTSCVPLLLQCRDVFIKKYGIQTYLQREHEKQS